MGAYLKNLDDFQLQGRTIGKRWAYGTAPDNTFIVIHGLAFKPSIVIIEVSNYNYFSYGGPARVVYYGSGNSTLNNKIYSASELGNLSWTIYNDGFQVSSSSYTFFGVTWMAIE